MHLTAAIVMAMMMMTMMMLMRTLMRLSGEFGWFVGSLEAKTSVIKNLTIILKFMMAAIGREVCMGGEIVLFLDVHCSITVLIAREIRPIVEQFII
jgi:hypothetical protein